MSSRMTVFVIMLGLLLAVSVSGMTIRPDADVISCGHIGASTFLNVTFRIYMDNNDFNRSNITLPLKLYSPDGSITNITHANVGGFGSTQSVRLLNGFEPGGFWTETNQLDEFSWDGVLPDGICFTGAAPSGWPSGLGEKDYIEFVVRFNSQTDGTFCIDTASNGQPHDWLFEDPQPVFQKKCWHVTPNPNMDLIMFYNVPVLLRRPFGTAFSWHFNAVHYFGNAVKYDIVSGPGNIDSATGEWTFSPSCEDIGDSLTLVVRGRDYCSDFAYGTCTLPIIVDPSFIPCNGCGDLQIDNALNILDVTFLVSYLYKNGPPPANLLAADIDHSGAVNVLDVTYFIDFLYKNGSYPLCP